MAILLSVFCQKYLFLFVDSSDRFTKLTVQFFPRILCQISRIFLQQINDIDLIECIFFRDRLIAFTICFSYHLTEFNSFLRLFDEIRDFLFTTNLRNSWFFVQSFVEILDFLLDYLTKFTFFIWDHLMKFTIFTSWSLDEISNFFCLLLTAFVMIFTQISTFCDL